MADKEKDTTEEKEQTAEAEAQTAEAEEVEINQTSEIQKQLEEKLMRIMAEYENYRKRTEREKTALYSVAKADTIEKFLPLFDNIEKAVALKPADVSGEWKAYSDGIDLIKRQLSDIFSALDVEAIDAVGEEFNPEFHNAVMHIEDENYGEGIIAEEFQKGFKMGDRIIRHSAVKVAN